MEKMTEGKLVFLPKGYRVVPEKLISHYCNAIDNLNDMPVSDKWADDWQRNAREFLKEAPPIDTPPVLRWERRGAVLHLMIGSYEFTTIRPLSISGYWLGMWKHGEYNTEQEARRAAEKALGFPDGLIIDEA